MSIFLFSWSSAKENATLSSVFTSELMREVKYKLNIDSEKDFDIIFEQISRETNLEKKMKDS